MSKKSYTSVYVKKVAPKFHQVLGYLTNKIPDESMVGVFKRLKFDMLDLGGLERGRAVPLTGNYDWKNVFLLGKGQKTLLYYQISLYNQRLSYVRGLPWPREEKISWILKSPPLMLLSIPSPHDEYPINNRVNYLRGIVPAENPFYIFAPLFPDMRGDEFKLAGSISKLAYDLRIDFHSMIKILMNIPKFLVPLSQNSNIYNLDLMTMPRAYNFSSHTLKMFPPVYSNLKNFNFIGDCAEVKPINHMNDFSGLEKYKKSEKNCDSFSADFESLLCLKYLQNPDGHLEDLSKFLIDSFKSREECRVYGLEYNKRLPKTKFLGFEGHEHALKEIEIFKKARTGLISSMYSKRNTNKLIRRIRFKRRPPSKS